jgi:hypothetical protein
MTDATRGRATDSPRWCANCKAWGDHHTDRHPRLGGPVVNGPGGTGNPKRLGSIDHARPEESDEQ